MEATLSVSAPLPRLISTEEWYQLLELVNKESEGTADFIDGRMTEFGPVAHFEVPIDRAAELDGAIEGWTLGLIYNDCMDEALA